MQGMYSVLALKQTYLINHLILKNLLKYRLFIYNGIIYLNILISLGQTYQLEETIVTVIDTLMIYLFVKSFKKKSIVSLVFIFHMTC